MFAVVAPHDEVLTNKGRHSSLMKLEPETFKEGQNKKDMDMCHGQNHRIKEKPKTWVNWAYLEIAINHHQSIRRDS